MAATMVERTFHPFPRLPVELRQAIWRQCLETRVCELDVPDPRYIYTVSDRSDAPCELQHTSILNAAPPLITRICRESRAEAFESGRAARRSCDAPVPEDAQWWSQTGRSWVNNWEDRVPAAVHLYWTPVYEAEFGSTYSDLASIYYLASAAARAGGQASILADRLKENFSWEEPADPWLDSDDEIEDEPQVREPHAEEQTYISAFQRARAYLVVMQVAVIHMDQKRAAATELFGHFGDAPIQILNMADEGNVSRYLDLARQCQEFRGDAYIAQDLEQRPCGVAKKRLRDYIVKCFGNEALVPIMEPAIMVRLCTRMCGLKSNN